MYEPCDYESINIETYFNKTLGKLTYIILDDDEVYVGLNEEIFDLICESGSQQFQTSIFGEKLFFLRETENNRLKKSVHRDSKNLISKSATYPYLGI